MIAAADGWRMSPPGEDLRPRWRVMWRALTANPAQTTDMTLLSALLAAYREPQRHYHTLQHLAECVAQFDALRSLAQRAAEVECALWFHDAIYDVRAHDNEQRSARWAAQALVAAGVGADTVARIDALILATRHTALPAPGDQQLLVDIDLAILGADPARFAQYEAQVREEYAWVPDSVYRQKRAAILQQFLGRDRIYGTVAMQERLEDAARRNLVGSIKALQTVVG